MKAIRFNGEISSITAKKDRSVGLRLNTPELTATEKADLMELQGINIDVFFKPLDTAPDDILTIDKDLNAKSSSRRLRAVLFILWKQLGEDGDFNGYYQMVMEKIINHFKEKLED